MNGKLILQKMQQMQKMQMLQIIKQAAGRHPGWTVGALLCVLLTGCGEADKALSIELGKAVESQEIPTEVETSESISISESVEEPVKICVYVCGAVKHPGVVTLPQGSRCHDALKAAGGFAEDAAEEAVNLARQVKDGEQIFFPTEAEVETLVAVEQNEQAGLVNINTADVDKLCELPGIGESKAQAIVLYREQNGAFAVAEDIMKIPGIKESAYNKIKDLITVQ